MSEYKASPWFQKPTRKVKLETTEYRDPVNHEGHPRYCTGCVGFNPPSPIHIVEPKNCDSRYKHVEA